MSDPTKKNVDAYRKTNVMTASKENLLLMLYAGAIRFTKLASDSEKAGNKPERNKWIMRVQEIVNELRATLNHDLGGELAENLDGLYAFITKALTEVMMEEKVENLDSVLSMLITLNEGWESAADNIKKERAKDATQQK